MCKAAQNFISPVSANATWLSYLPSDHRRTTRIRRDVPFRFKYAESYSTTIMTRSKPQPNFVSLLKRHIASSHRRFQKLSIHGKVSS